MNPGVLGRWEGTGQILGFHGGRGTDLAMTPLPSPHRIASSNNLNKSESDQEDNDDINDNDWSYGSEKKAKKRKSDKNPNSPRRSKSLKHKNGEG
ncbi:ataxin-7-like protein 3, partial [Neopelma chrysocephalum]|uniref:ataxin-7-like protein 3 n=1 Tax=Neopelma chrysocephalum TaxID=114329 RepID=UPI000FCD3E1F